MGLCLQKEIEQNNANKKMWDHAIDVKEGFVLRKKKVYLLSREERGDV